MQDEFNSKIYDEQEKQTEEQPDILSTLDDPYNPLFDFNNVLNYLFQELEGNRGRMNKRVCTVDFDKISSICNDLYNNVPRAIQYCNKIVENRDEILGNAETEARRRLDEGTHKGENALREAEAKADAILQNADAEAKEIVADAQAHADSIVHDAEIKARTMVDQNTIKVEAKQKADEIIGKATADAYTARAGVLDYCEHQVNTLMEPLRGILEDMNRVRNEIRAERAGKDDRA